MEFCGKVRQVKTLAGQLKYELQKKTCQIWTEYKMTVMHDSSFLQNVNNLKDFLMEFLTSDIPVDKQQWISFGRNTAISLL